jgi:hypothetical protein
MTYDKWLAAVERELVRLGVEAFEVKSEIDDDRDWFDAQHEAGAAAEITALEWFEHQR